MGQEVLKLRLGEYRVGETTGKIIGSPGSYFLLVYGDEMRIKRVAQTPDGSQAVVFAVKKGFEYIVQPSPIEKEA
jgi:hypothetical protein